MNKEEYEKRKELIELEHERKMEQLRYARETETLVFDYKKQITRIIAAKKERTILLKNKLKDEWKKE